MLSPHMPDLAAPQVLLAVAETGSINAAAVQVGVSQQAISVRDDLESGRLRAVATVHLDLDRILRAV